MEKQQLAVIAGFGTAATLFANIVIAIAKLIGGLISGSTGMLADAAIPLPTP